MTKEEKQELEFYKNGSAESVLKRFVFSEIEGKLVKDAIRTAQLANPRMKLIRDADELLKEVAKTRDPIIKAIESVPIEAIVKMEALKFSQSKPKEKKQKTWFIYIPETKAGMIVITIAAIILLVYS